MTTSIKATADGLSGELQVNGVTALKLVQGQAVPTSSTLTEVQLDDLFSFASTVTG